MIRRLLCLLMLFCSLVVAPPICAENWPQWRGPGGDGVSQETDLPITWSDESGVEWKIKLPAWGDSTPAIWGDAIFATSQLEKGELVLLRIDKSSGGLQWTRQIGVGAPRLPTSGRKSPDMRRHQEFHREQNMATPSPVTDGQVVVVHFGNGDLAAYDFDGQQLWHRNLQQDHGDYTIWWGHANSPVLCGKFVISVCMQDSCKDLPGDPSPSYVVAHDTMTGEQRWMTMRMTDATHEHCDAYTTPILRQTPGRQEIVVMGGQVLDAYDPSNGKRLWHLSGLVGNRLIPSPVAAQGMIFATQGMREAMLAVKVDGRGERSRDDIVWEYEEGTSDSPSPVVSGDLIYFVSNNGIARCLNAHHGTMLWVKRFRGQYRASPIAAADRIYFLNTDGMSTVIADLPDFEQLAENQLDDQTIASPAISDGRLFIRGRKWLYCLK
jgi:outer membrane protein assembly factor BamB